MRRVILVDDEETLVWTLLRQARSTRPDIAFEGFTDPLQALESIRRRPPDVLVTDLRMPGVSGIDLLVAARHTAPNLPVIIVSAYGTPEVRAEIQRNSGVQFLEKPLAFQALVGAVDRALAPRSGFSGAIDLPLLPDLIQIYAIGQSTGMLRIVRGLDRGEIYFLSGEITHAVCGGLKGEPAFHQIMRWEGGVFGMDNGALAIERTIDLSWQELLLEGCRLDDEEQAARMGLGPRAASAIGPAPTDPPLPVVPELQVDALWARLGPEIAKAAPEAVVVAAAIGARGLRVLHGPKESLAFAAALVGIEQVGGRLPGAGAQGAVEWMASDCAAFVSWDVSAGLLLGIFEELSGPSAAARFRSNLSRFQGHRPWLRS